MYYEPQDIWTSCTTNHMRYEPHVLWTTWDIWTSCTMKQYVRYEPPCTMNHMRYEPHALQTTWDMNLMYYEPHEIWTSCTMNHTKSVVHSTLLKNVLCLHCTAVCDSYDSMIFNLHDPLYNEAIYLGVFVFQLITAFWYSWVFIVEYPSLILSLFQQDDYLWLHALTVHKGHNDQ